MKIIKLPYKKAVLRTLVSNKPVQEVEKVIIKKKVKDLNLSLDKCIICNKINCICNEKDKEVYSS